MSTRVSESAAITLDVRGISGENRGAELMLHAIVGQLGARCRLSIPPQSAPFELRSKYQLSQTLHDYRLPKAFTAAGNLVPSRYRQLYGLVRSRDISGVLDASGYAYGDPFTLRRIERELAYAEGWAKRRIPQVLLPQAFGPFTDTRKSAAAKRRLNLASLIFARDERSKLHLEVLDLDVVVKVCPDFTSSVALDVAPNPTVGDKVGMLIVNSKLFESLFMSREGYNHLLMSYRNALARQGLRPVWLVHESRDANLTRDLARVNNDEVIFSLSPITLKQEIGRADFLISSRYHGLVGGLSQNVPSISLGWSHKYEALLEDFGVAHWRNRDEEPEEHVNRVISDQVGVSVMSRRRYDIEKAVANMWDEVEDVLGVESPTNR